MFAHEVTRLLDAAASGDPRAAADHLPLVYDELRRLAAAHMATEKPGHTLQATALVNEAYFLLVGSDIERPPDGPKSGTDGMDAWQRAEYLRPFSRRV